MICTQHEASDHVCYLNPYKYILGYRVTSSVHRVHRFFYAIIKAIILMFVVAVIFF